ncbi:hypothetical protein RDABS01_021707 [Bienertia sinuspersici]
MDIVTIGTLRFWHGGIFKRYKNTGLLKYVRGQGRTFTVDIDELCWCFLEEMARKFGGYSKIDQIYYLIPKSNLDEGLHRVYSDKEVLEMGEIVKINRVIELYVQHGIDVQEIIPSNEINDELVGVEKEKSSEEDLKTTTKKLVSTQQRSSPRCKPTTSTDKDPVFEGPVKDPPNQANVKHTTKNPKASNKPTTSPTPITEPQQTILPQHDDCFDDRPDSPIPFSELVSDVESEDDDDPVYEPVNEQSEQEDDLEGYVEEQFGEDHELDDENEIGDENKYDELRDERNKVGKTNAQLLELSRQLQQKAEKGKIQSKGVGSNKKESAPSTQNTEGEGPLSEYEDSDEEIDTPNESEEDESGIRRKSSRGLLVIEDTDWHSFVWKVGYRLTSRESFRKAITHFAIAQGRNISLVSSSKKRQQKMEARCVPGCPFRVYGSWDSRREVFVVKSVDSEHTCNRNMEKNKQLNSTWVAR